MNSLKASGPRGTAAHLALATVALASACAMPAAFGATARTFYVDCTAAAGGPGNVTHPFRRLSAVNQLQLGPGDRVLLKRGTTCLGTLALRGSGTQAAPIRIGAYGTGAKPIINANGGAEAVLLQGESHIRVSDLDLSAPGNNSAARRGVYVYAKNAGTVSGIELTQLTVHDVRGLLPERHGSLKQLGAGKYAGASGGIIFDAAGTKVPTAFNDVVIADNDIYGVDREGIYTWSNWCRRPQLASGWHQLCTGKWDPSTHIVIRGNHLDDIGGDGIAPMTSIDVLVERNALSGFNTRGKGYNAGMWTANSDNVVFQHNVVTGGTSNRDGMAYDVDNSTSGVVFQYNLSYDNDGGFFLICPWNTPVKNFVIRYNTSVDDHARGFELCSGPVLDGHIYNNTIYIGPDVKQQVVVAQHSKSTGVYFTNNIVANYGANSNVTWKVAPDTWVMDHNDFYRVPAPAWATHSMTADPRFCAGGTLNRRGYRLADGSSLAAAGIRIHAPSWAAAYGPGDQGSADPNIGAYAEGTGCVPPGVPAVSGVQRDSL